MTSSSSISISTISLVVPAQSPDMVILAAGKGSGSVEVCICHISNNEFQSIGIYDAHDQKVSFSTVSYLTTFLGNIWLVSDVVSGDRSSLVF